MRVKIADVNRIGEVVLHEGLGRVDLVVAGKLVDATNVVNDDFPDHECLEKSMSEWGLRLLKEFRRCDICRMTKYAPPLHDYDVKNFPDLKGKVVCRDCRSKRYDQLIVQIISREKTQWLSAFKWKKRGVRVLDINVCMFPKCNCGWNITIDGGARILGRMDHDRLYVRKEGERVTIGGRADQWQILDKICRLAGGRVPDGYPPKHTRI